MPEQFLAPLCLVLLVLVIIQFFLISSLNGRITRQTKSLRTFFSTAGGEDIEELLRKTLAQSQESYKLSTDVAQRLDDLAAQVDTCLQHVGLVRYDAFGDVTGQQSFSLALLDGSNNGTIITALFGRANSRCYGKIIVAGQAQQNLTDEEQEALLQALEHKVDKGR